MAKTLAIIGSIIRATEIETRSVLRLSGTEVITADELSTISIAPTGSFTPSFAQVPTGSFLLLDADGPLDVTIDGGAPVRAKQVYLSGARVQSLVLSNPNVSTAVILRFLVGGNP